MNTKKDKNPSPIVAAVGLSIALASSAHSAITVAGSTTAYHSTSGDWLSNTTNDIDGNGQGTDGWFFLGLYNGTQSSNQPFTTNVQSLPGYVTSVTSGADFLSVAHSFAGYGIIDSPVTLDGTDAIGGTLVARNGTGLPAGDFIDDAMSFTVAGLPANTTTRVGILSQIEGSGDGRWDPTSITLTDGTVSATVGDHAAAPLPTGGNNVGWVYFDIDADGTYTLQGTKRLAGNQGIGFGGLTFDSVVIPEPSTGLLALLGASVLLRRRR